MIRVWALQYAWQVSAEWRVIRQVEALIADGRNSTLSGDELRFVRGQLLVLDAQAAFFRCEVQRAAALCQEALTIFPSSWNFMRGAAMFYLGLAMQASGDGQAAARLLLDEYASLVGDTGSYGPLLLSSCCHVLHREGQLEQVRRVAQMLLDKPRVRCRFPAAGATIFSAWLTTSRANFDAAREHFDRVVHRRYVTQVLIALNSFFGLILTEQARGEYAAADQTLALLSQFDLETSSAEAERTASLAARLMLLRGDLAGASLWADAFTSPPAAQPLHWPEEPHLTKARHPPGQGCSGRRGTGAGPPPCAARDRRAHVRLPLSDRDPGGARSSPRAARPLPGRARGVAASGRSCAAGRLHPPVCRSRIADANPAAPTCRSRVCSGYRSPHPGRVPPARGRAGARRRNKRPGGERRPGRTPYGPRAGSPGAPSRALEQQGDRTAFERFRYDREAPLLEHLPQARRRQSPGRCGESRTPSRYYLQPRSFHRRPFSYTLSDSFRVYPRRAIGSRLQYVDLSPPALLTGGSREPPAHCFVPLRRSSPVGTWPGPGSSRRCPRCFPSRGSIDPADHSAHSARRN